ncbi:hypothetical protein ACFQY4_27825 [Catellatospora bangladeshensis]|uniref:hypothetical protein n=1 Tax=Catellatospora bangladeshensis TaxID=310355 RepID=UPI0036152B52
MGRRRLARTGHFRHRPRPQRGALTVLPLALSYQACYRIHAGDFELAAALADEADAISAAVGSAPMVYPALVLSAWRGQEAQAHRLTAAARAEAAARGEDVRSPSPTMPSPSCTTGWPATTPH